mmetsp:Transcript_76591/g.135112  ORF Transcript_76591/g.135112 Transcript_76591/m.135112 type:complete len:217 (+) Transcript_76591:71-721(+)|eukprot:CAMPEP_0197654976 /NCGR_PEP_ID=MMETSP1338-20131121/39175_1 /TAXON_ID=43686 ORGANISM="Pelagodinium beii, Strain RCC1491" /NCGR_SAMPLE_ID=MMETSP1338 /ASSEMBLY_ACC=CAM_ASM_000754 /LENGTH=216 /DNA_ID=CAMNT_0043230531 /DNA_START=67 /DNA_END=717 /DNA_ORIENTATION=+
MPRSVLMLMIFTLSQASEDMLTFDDACDSESCSLELKQLRAQKVNVAFEQQEQDKDEEEQDELDVQEDLDEQENDELGGQSCMNHKDLTIMKTRNAKHNQLQVDIDMSLCGKTCADTKTGKISGPCTKGCMMKRGFFTPPCAKCFGEFAECGSDECKAKCERKVPCKHLVNHPHHQCTDDKMEYQWRYTEACKSCLNKKCGSSFKACSGADIDSYD